MIRPALIVSPAASNAAASLAICPVGIEIVTSSDSCARTALRRRLDDGGWVPAANLPRVSRLCREARSDRDVLLRRGGMLYPERNY